MRLNLAKVASRRDFTDSGFVMSVETISESAIFSESAVSLRVSAFRPARTILAPASTDLHRWLDLSPRLLR